MTVSRRTAIMGAAVSAAALGAASLPAVAAAPVDDATLLALAAELIAIRVTWDERAKGHEDDIAYDICDQPEAELASAIERQIGAIRPTTLKGFCVKLLIATSFGDFFTTDELVQDAMEISGFLPEPSHPKHPDYVRPDYVRPESAPTPSDTAQEIYERVASLSPDLKREYARRLRSDIPDLAPLADKIEAWADRQTA